ncbi:sigma-54-dependent Fis family transcriptional regulator [Sphingorhabdus lutea]|uniref:Sigma-54-dependent Fis family transcriptional regulator n=1 Tax=Sphingorhabdus lutea TaxID=1913578 RepID=A0A1L3JC32_9SPHN|nr:sigma-54 dependent transcriptional regulator [Sphingorhabdus lutea]APG62707.1 sigma-54-dependent Fis family transcriptional regulator [Sphingorhabdus lutea]
MEILVVDDEKDIRDIVAGVLSDEGYSCRTAMNSDEALASINERRPSLVLLDVWLRGSKLDGLELLKEIKKCDRELPVIVFSGHGNIDTAVAAISMGAVDFIEKPFEAEQLVHLVARATENEALKQENAALLERVGQADGLTGTSTTMNNIRATLKKVAATGSRLFISGPPGVGKEVAARLLHKWSNRASGAFVTFSVARINLDKIDEHLFGIEENGSLIQAGVLERAHGGTLFIDEIADFPPETQGKLLHILTDKGFTRTGGTRPINVDIRLVSATSTNIEEKITEGTFREDLYYRINVVPLALPALADRREDIAELIDFYVNRFCAEHRVAVPQFNQDAMNALQSYSWPGNIRQLRNVIEHIVILAPVKGVQVIDIDMLPHEIHGDFIDQSNNLSNMMSYPLREARESFEREYLRIQVKRFSGNISRTANFIGMERSALHRKLKLLGLNDPKKSED